MNMLIRTSVTLDYGTYEVTVAAPSWRHLLFALAEFGVKSIPEEKACERIRIAPAKPLPTRIQP